MSYPGAVVKLLTLLPQNSISRILGDAAAVEVPAFLRKPLIEAFAKAIGADLGEAELHPGGYKSIAHFFGRRLKPGARTFPESDFAVASPADGLLRSFGDIQNRWMEQVKGIRFDLESLLLNPDKSNIFRDGKFLNIYLSPKDYHRVHAPLEAKVIGYGYVPGGLLPVNGLTIGKVPALFTMNERLITYLETVVGKVAVVMVGAMVVGRIRAAYEDLVTNRSKGRVMESKDYAEPIELAKGAEIGTFELGSSVVMLFEPGKVEFADLEPGMDLKLGQVVAKAVKRENRP